jgi:uncharacterized protein YndB with AHSA1/START domain
VGSAFYWIMVGVGILAGVMLVICVIGSFQPRSHVVTRAITTRQPPDNVWQLITDFAAGPTWRQGIIAVERLPDHDGHAVWRETYKGNYKMTLETTEAAPPHRLVRTIADEKGPFRGRWEFDLSAVEGGSRLAITEHGEIPNPFFRFMARMFMDPAMYLEDYLRALGTKFGETPALERVTTKP